MKQIFIFLIKMLSFNFCAASQEYLLSPKSNRSHETVYDYRDNFCAVCIRPCVGDDGFRQSKCNRCVQIGCAMCTGAICITTALVWFMQQHPAKGS